MNEEEYSLVALGKHLVSRCYQVTHLWVKADRKAEHK
jgi:hypothetical protein